MTKFFAGIVAAFIMVMSAVPVAAFSIASDEVVDRSADYENLPMWQEIVAERGDSIYSACATFVAAGGDVLWPQCGKAILAENRGKFPVNRTRDSDYYLREGETYFFPVVPGRMNFSAAPLTTAALAARQQEFFDTVRTVIAEFNQRVGEIETAPFTEAEIKDMIDTAIANAARTPDGSLTDELSAALEDRLAQLEATVADHGNRLGELEGGVTELREQLDTKADAVAVASALADVNSDIETVQADAGKAIADAASAKAVAEQAATDAAAAKTAADAAGQVVVKGLAADGEITKAIDVAASEVSWWLKVAGVALGVLAFILILFIGWRVWVYRRQREAGETLAKRIDAVEVRVTDGEQRLDNLEVAASTKRQLEVPSELENELSALADGRQYVATVTVDRTDYELTFTKAPDHNGKPMVTAAGIKDQTQPIAIDRVRGTILRAGRDNRLVHKVTASKAA